MIKNDKELILDFKQPQDEQISLETTTETIPIFSKSENSFTADDTELQINWDRVKNTTIQQRTNIFNRLSLTPDSNLMAKFQVVDNELFYDVYVDGETMITRFKMRKFFFTHKRKLQRFSVIDLQKKISTSNPLTMFEYNFEGGKRRKIFELEVLNSEFFKTYVTKRYLGLFSDQGVRIFCKNRRKRLVSLKTNNLGGGNDYSGYFFNPDDKLYEIKGWLFFSIHNCFVGINLMRKTGFDVGKLTETIKFRPKMLLYGHENPESECIELQREYQDFGSYVPNYDSLRDKSKLRYLKAFMHVYLHSKNLLPDFKKLAKDSILLVGFECNSKPCYLKATENTIKVFQKDFREVEKLFDVGQIEGEFKIKLAKVRFIHEEDIMRIKVDAVDKSDGKSEKTFIIFFKIYAADF